MWMLFVPEEVLSYRSVRHPKMDQAMDQAEKILSGKTSPVANPANSPKQLSKV